MKLENMIYPKLEKQNSVIRNIVYKFVRKTIKIFIFIIYCIKAQTSYLIPKSHLFILLKIEIKFSVQLIDSIV